MPYGPSADRGAGDAGDRLRGGARAPRGEVRAGRARAHRSGCLGVTPRTKQALAHALDHADGQPLGDERILLGMLTVPDSLAAQILGKLGVSQHAAEAIVTRRDE